jgi:hypothetical protein
MKLSEPEWMKLPDASEWCGLSVSEIFRRCMSEEIESVHLVKPGKRKGVRLVNRASLDEYIRSFLPGGSRNPRSKPKDLSAK